MLDGVGWVVEGEGAGWGRVGGRGGGCLCQVFVPAWYAITMTSPPCIMQVARAVCLKSSESLWT